MTLEQVGEAVDGRAVVVLSSNRYLSQITLLRGQTVELIFGSSSGPAHPQGRSAHGHPGVHRSGDRRDRPDQPGGGLYPGGRPGRIQAGGDPHRGVRLLCGLPATEGRAVLRAGDEVIVRATGLYDGKLLNF